MNPKPEELDLYIQHKAAFNKAAFSMDGDSLARTNGSFILTKHQWETIVYILNNWNLENIEERQRFRASNKVGYQLVKKYSITQTRQLTKIEKSKSTRLMVLQMEIFDIINDEHLAIGHKKRYATTKKVKSKYYNIPRRLIELYINLCPICRKT